MKRLAPLALLALVSMTFVACDVVDPMEADNEVTAIGSDIGSKIPNNMGSGVSGGIVSPLILRISDNGTEERLNHFNNEYWYEDTIEGEVLAVEGGYYNENPEVNTPNVAKFVIRVNEYGNNEILRNGKVVEGAANAIDIATGNGVTFALNSYGTISTIRDGDAGFLYHSSLSQDCINDPAKRIDVEADGTPWVISRDAKAYKYENGKWVVKGQSPNYKGIDIGCGDGIVYALSTKTTDNNIYLWSFTEADGWTRYVSFKDANKIDVDNTGRVWIHNWFLGYTQSVDPTTGERTDYGISLNNSDIGACNF